MARVFITGSSDGIGLRAAQMLADNGHHVTLHARNEDRAKQAKEAVPQAEDVLIGDLKSIPEIKKLAADANAKGAFDTVIHNAGIGYGATSSRETTADGIAAVFSVNTLAPYILTCIMSRPTSRLLFMSSDSHYGGDASLKDCAQSNSYSNSKLHNNMLAHAFARHFPNIQVISMHPGWVRTKMGGSAPGSSNTPAKALSQWAAGEGPLVKVKSGAFVETDGETSEHSGASNVKKQDELLKICEDISGVSVPD